MAALNRTLAWLGLNHAAIDLHKVATTGRRRAAIRKVNDTIMSRAPALQAM
jgi:hypothetical protein